MMEATNTSETSVSFYQTTLYNIPGTHLDDDDDDVGGVRLRL
jgi:hypothetical protein